MSNLIISEFRSPLILPKFSDVIQIKPDWYIWKHRSGERDPDNLDKNCMSWFHFPHNQLMYEGATTIIGLIADLNAETPYDNTNARIGVGNGTAAIDPTHTDLQGGTTLYKGMETASFPAIEGANNNQLAFQSVFNNGEAEFNWQEFAVDNGATASKFLNRKLQAQGTKTANNDWTIKVVFTFA